MLALQKYQNKKIAIYGMGLTGCSAAHFSLYPTFLLPSCPKLQNSQLSPQLSQLSQLSQKLKV